MQIRCSTNRTINLKTFHFQFHCKRKKIKIHFGKNHGRFIHSFQRCNYWDLRSGNQTRTPAHTYSFSLSFPLCSLSLSLVSHAEGMKADSYTRQVRLTPPPPHQPSDRHTRFIQWSHLFSWNHDFENRHPFRFFFQSTPCDKNQTFYYRLCKKLEA